jgi:MFS family permease
VADSLKRDNQFDRLRKTFATGAICRALAILVGGLIGAYIADATSLRFVMELHVIFAAAALTVALFFMHSDGEPEHRVTELEAFLRSWRLLRDHKALKWSTIAAISFGVVALWNMYWTVFFGPRVGGQENLGWVWVVLYGAVTVAGFLVRRMKVAGGQEEAGMAMALGATAVGFLLAGLFQSLPLLIMALMMHEAGRGAFEPLLDSFTQHHVDSSHRATYASFQSLISKVGFVSALAVGALSIGKLPETDAVQHLWRYGGLFLFAVTALLFIARPRHRDKAS